MRLSSSQTVFRQRVVEACEELAGTEEQRAALSADDTTVNAPAAYELLAERGLLGISLPAEYGGGGGTFVEDCIFLEETARHGVPVMAYSTALTAAQSYLKFGDDRQRSLIVSTIRRGGLEAVAFTEPDAGSDLAMASTRARRDGDEWVIDGRKTWISFANLATHILLLTRTDATADRHDGLSLIMVPADAAGVDVRPIATMGAPIAHDIELTGVRVPLSNLVGVEGEAWRHLGRGLAVERVIIGAMCVGAAQRALDRCVAWVTGRVQFGKPLSKQQALRHRLADLAAEIAVVRSFVYDIADRIDEGAESRLNAEASMAKLRGSETFKKTTSECVQLMGGYGYGSAWGMEQQHRMAMATTIYGGANEVQREIISRSLGL
ncbi:MAG: acyl-CoA dehydrogenase family protein [Humibacter sp.]